MGGECVNSTVILDTHVLLWHVSESEKLSPAAITTIGAAQTIAVSTISAWEVGMLVEKGRLSLTHDVSDWIEIAGTLPRIQWIPVDTKIALRSTRLPGLFHKDPADRIITATALTLGAKLITADSKLHEYMHIQTVW